MDDAKLRSYLLQELSEAEQIQMEERLFMHEEFLDRIAVIEDELIDAFVREELPAQQRRRFETHFLPSSRASNRVTVAASLLKRASAEGIYQARRSRMSLEPFSFSRWTLQAAVFMAAAVAVSSALFCLRLRNSKTLSNRNAVAN